MSLATLPVVAFGDKSVVDTSATRTVGTRAWDSLGNEYIYLGGCVGTLAGSWVLYDENYATSLLTAGAVGPLCVAQAAVVAGSYGWYLREGICDAKTGTVEADRPLYACATSGTADATVVIGDLISGAFSLAASVAGVTRVQVSRPCIGNVDAATANAVFTTNSYADPSWITSLAKSKVGLGIVENTALSTWAGTANITTLGTIVSGVWNAGSVTSSGGISGTTGTFSGAVRVVGDLSVGASGTPGIGGDTASLYLKASGNVYLNSANNSYVTPGGNITIGGTLTIGSSAVSYGANDSAGTGYRVLRVPNA